MRAKSFKIVIPQHIEKIKLIHEAKKYKCSIIDNENLEFVFNPDETIIETYSAALELMEKTKNNSPKLYALNGDEIQEIAKIENNSIYVVNTPCL